MNYGYSKWCLILVLSAGFFSTVHAGNWDISSETILRTFQRDTLAENDEIVVPVYEYLSVDYCDKEDGGIAFHGYGWVFKDAAESEFFNKDSEGEVLYAYLSYAKPYSTFKVNLGRQHIFSGIVNDSLDGLRIDIGLNQFISLSAFGGIPVATGDTDGRDKDTLYGGRLGILFPPAAELGLSYKTIQDFGNTQENTAGLDFYWSPLPAIAVDGKSAFNVETQGWREHHYGARFLVKDFEIRPLFQHFIYKDYFSPAKNPKNLFRYLYNSDETMTIWGADAGWYGTSIFNITFKGRQYTFKAREEDASFYSGGVVSNLPHDVSVGLEVGRMNGRIKEDQYQLFRGYCLWTDPPILGHSSNISVDALYQVFDEPLYNTDTAFFLSLSTVRGFANEKCRLSASVNYSQDPYFDDDVSAMMTILLSF